MTYRFRAGDIVRHIPSGETWTLACDEHGGRVVPCGWPETWAPSFSCKLIENSLGPERSEILRKVSRLDGLRGAVARLQFGYEVDCFRLTERRYRSQGDFDAADRARQRADAYEQGVWFRCVWGGRHD